LVVYIVYINDARSSKYQIMKYICWLNISVLWRVVKRLSLYRRSPVPKG